MATATKNNKSAPKLRALALAEVLARKKGRHSRWRQVLEGVYSMHSNMHINIPYRLRFHNV